MTEQIPETTATETETGEQVTPKPTRPTETVDFWKTKAREQEIRAKANASAAEKLAAFEDRDKTETQRMLDRAEAAEKRADAAEASSLRAEIAAAKGLTPAQAKRLIGGSRDELEADADDLLETFKTPAVADESTALADSLDLGVRGKASISGGPGTDFAKFISSQLGR